MRFFFLALITFTSFSMEKTKHMNVSSYLSTIPTEVWNKIVFNSKKIDLYIVTILDKDTADLKNLRLVNKCIKLRIDTQTKIFRDSASRFCNDYGSTKPVVSDPLKLFIMCTYTKNKRIRLLNEFSVPTLGCLAYNLKQVKEKYPQNFVSNIDDIITLATEKHDFGAKIGERVLGCDPL